MIFTYLYLAHFSSMMISNVIHFPTGDITLFFFLCVCAPMHTPLDTYPCLHMEVNLGYYSPGPTHLLLFYETVSHWNLSLPISPGQQINESW